MGWGEWAIIIVLAVGLVAWIVDEVQLRRRGLRR